MVRRANSKTDLNRRRREKSIILLALEGKNKTEKTYFGEFNNANKQYRVLFAKGNNTDPVNIVKDAISSYKKMELEKDAGDLAFVVCDTDFHKEDQIQEARTLAEQNNITLLLSNPCFEIWLLLHFKYTTKQYASNLELLKELEDIWPEYSKNIGSFDGISDRRPLAIDNAKQLKQFHKLKNQKTYIEKCNPSTDVHILVELLDDEEKK